MRETARIGVDIGGTFTDVVLITDTGRISTRKLASTPHSPEAAVLDGIAAALEDAGLAPADVRGVLHGTTVGSNAILQGTGGPAGLITTRGFRDVLEIGRLRTPGMFDLTWDKPAPLVPRRLRLEVTERIAADGGVIRPLDIGELRDAAANLAGAGVTSIAVCFLNSYRNPDHEREAGAWLRAAHPGIAVTLSVDVLPEQREYERTSTAVVNAYVLPVMRGYIAALRSGLAAMGIAAPLLVANSNGGLARAAVAMEKPVFFVSSGRAAGAAGAAALGRRIGQGDLVAFDMGGTTASAALIAGGVLSRTTEYEFRAGISTPSRFIKAGGYLMRVPTVDVAEIGSGGGSIAHVDAGGLICVGPRSAGAAPGPACYGGGGAFPTVTDANLVLGFLPGRLAGGSVVLDVAAARAAIEREVARPLGLDVEAAALGIRAVVNAGMARAIRAVTVERGVDPRDFTLLAFGGSGPNHACDLARMLEIRRVLFPPAPGVFTALGMLSGAIEHFFIRAFPGALGALDAAALRHAAEAMAAEARSELEAEGLDPAAARFDFGIDLRFAGQDSELRIDFDPGRAHEDPEALRARFLARYRETYGYASEGRIEAVNLRLTASAAPGESAAAPGDDPRPRAAPRPDPVSSRPIRFAHDEDWRRAPVFHRDDFAGPVEGPCAIESADTTIVVPPGARAEGDAAGNILVRLDG